MGDVAIIAPDRAWEVLTLYYDFKVQFAGRKRPKRTPKRAHEYAARYVVWAEEQRIDPVLFMRTMFERFASAKPGSCPSISAMRSKKMLALWRDRDEAYVLQQESFRTMKRVVRTDREREIIRLRAKPTKAQEAARTDYTQSGKVQLCMLDESTGGYDPRSRVCPDCLNKYACLLGTNKRAGFDVGALRVGMFDRLPPDVRSVATTRG